MTSLSDKIYVTSKELIQPASSKLGIDEDKVDWISFGQLDVMEQNVDRNFEKKCTKFSEVDDNTMIGMWVGNLKRKNLYSLKKSLELVNNKGKYNIKLLIIGHISTYLVENDKVGLFGDLKAHKSVLVYDSYLDVKKSKLTREIDFFWRGVTDLSIPETLYHAASENYPICVPSGTFLGSYVEKYKIGTSIDTNNVNDIDRAMSFVQAWPPVNAVEFLRTHNWGSLASKLQQDVNIST
jgi:hypothetical protein